MMLVLIAALQAATLPPPVPTEQRVKLEEYGACIAHDGNFAASRLLRTDFRTAQYRDGLTALLARTTACMPKSNQVRIARLLAAGAISEGLLERDGGALLRKLPANAATTTQTGFSATDVAAVCTIKHDAAGAAALFATSPDSAAEKASLAGLSKGYAACLPPGRAFRFNPAGLRAMLASAAYRIAAGDDAAGSAE